MYWWYAWSKKKAASWVSTSTEFIIGAVTVEVVTLAEFAAVAFFRIVSLLALAGATHALSVIAADVRAVVLAAVLVQVFGGHLVFSTFTLPAHTSLIAPERTQLTFTHTKSLAYMFMGQRRKGVFKHQNKVPFSFIICLCIRICPV